MHNGTIPVSVCGMSYQIESSESVEKAVRRLAAHQLDRALVALDAPDNGFDSAVHEVRRRCKRTRAVVRLARGSLAEFDQQDDALRDTAALLSHTRDAAVLAATHSRIMSKVDRDLDVAAVAHALGLGDGPPVAAMRSTEILAKVRQRLEQTRTGIDRWHLDGRGFSAIRAGVESTYARARRAMTRAKESQDSLDCHRWRKRVKYHAFQMHILRELWPQALRVREDAATEIGELLGVAHDCANYRAALDAARARGVDGDALEALSHAARELESELLGRSWPIGRRLFAMTPAVFADELEAYWDAWRRS